jgi:hypothetical protein
MRYLYSLIRFVPEPANGEFVVLGAVAGSDETSDWDIRQISNPVRARALDRRGALDLAWALIDGIGREIDRFEESTSELFEPEVRVSERWLWDMHLRHRNIVQLSAPTPMVAEAADEALDRIFDEMVVDPARVTHRFKTKHAALGRMRAAYRRQGIDRDHSLRERVSLHAADYVEPFDFAVTNGRVLQLAHTWSFQIPDQDELTEQLKSWGWTVERLRESGGTVSTRLGQQFDVDREVDIEISYVPPDEDRASPAFAEALGVFKTCAARQVPYQEADSIGRRARDLLSSEAQSP